MLHTLGDYSGPVWLDADLETGELADRTQDNFYLNSIVDDSLDSHEDSHFSLPEKISIQPTTTGKIKRRNGKKKKEKRVKVHISQFMIRVLTTKKLGLTTLNYLIKPGDVAVRTRRVRASW